MSKGLQWTIGISLVLIVIAMIFSAILPFFAPRLGLANDYGYGMMGPGHMFGGGPMMFGGFGMPFFGFFMWLVPLLFIGLVVLGIIWLVRAVSAPNTAQPPIAAVACSHCGKPLQAGWVACPHCGEKV